MTVLTDLGRIETQAERDWLTQALWQFLETPPLDNPDAQVQRAREVERRMGEIARLDRILNA